MDVQTASPVVLIERLYAASLRHTRIAREAQGDPRRRGESVSRVISIVGELRQSLSFERGGEIAANLDALYGYVTERLAQGNRGDARAFDDVLGVLAPLHDAWTQLAARPEAELVAAVEADAREQE